MSEEAAEEATTSADEEQKKAEKPSTTSQLARLARMDVLVLDNDEKTLDMMKTVLSRLGFTSVKTARDGFLGLKHIKQYNVDMIITDWELKPLSELAADDIAPNDSVETEWEMEPPGSGARFVEYLRGAQSVPNRYVPIIMLTGPTLANNVLYARDAGASEILKKPIGAKLLCDRIIACIEKPRSFITSPAYKGPDRRRREVPVDEERRKIEIRVISYDERAK